MSDVTHLILRVGELSASDRAEMWLLMTAYYLGVEPQQFEADLDEKEHVILLRNGSTTGRIVGFSTLMRLDLEVAGQPVVTVFSGDTIVDRSRRGTFGLGMEIARYFHSAVQETTGVGLYYILIAKGWQTSRIPRLLFQDYSPSPDRPTPCLHRQIMDAFGAKKYPNNYRPRTGLIDFGGETQRVMPESAEGIIPARPDAQVDFFVKSNPNYLQGSELVYVAEIAEGNFTPVFKKLLNLTVRPHSVG
jgi:hypothetical protein